MKEKEVKRGDIFYADLSPVVGSEQGGQRPVVIIQNNVGNHFSTTVIVAPITTHSEKKLMPTHVPLTTEITGIPRNSVVLLEQVRTIDKQRLMDRIDHLGPSVMKKVNRGLQISLAL
ncbi:type II toxin-antitoxin system PemK/MazF family toxin [Limosilactobacillus fastidiosus]|uniref:mRNA interferase n=1 Tax=Limosilactobacillus fastidiosus TaxID=2759855 RepID=A0A7W3YBE3_9LACO|nr:type II toxin-antitoxin system PemK/MazF family toxin [Limosilactobacillus fastidiosus]MBB1062475.1 type II toxin-antitoxin system PemK/MazF family toxin [Limosilactobacillus fastidiosus]MBB1085574.1 type II toxin-antitoxin system PemK/MazF family toxin [Limosilactobacillus fastidiosus]MCD7083549.1 type II toxin-antitoxin system PemK/MazF family toxin [Limosilactobacillus fastidiosus]MCD7086027.1 type II toxin-antitoxin system PemK/MazF family toxin [Limosilactobacillus fastidiosus]MCD71143